MLAAMRVTIRYFAAARERAGTSSETLELHDAATAAAARAAARARHPALQPVAQRLRLAVDQEFAAPESRLRDGSEVALIPPVSGGAVPHRIGPAVVAPEAPLREVAGADCGAVVSFVGTVRATNHGKRVVRLRDGGDPGRGLRNFEPNAAPGPGKWGARPPPHPPTR